MKLLVVTHSYYPAFKMGGPSKSMHLINKYLVMNGIEVTVVSTNTGLSEDENIKFNKWITIDGVKVKFFNTYGNKFYNVSPGMLTELYGIVEDVDLVYISPLWNFPCVAAGVISRLKKKKYVLSPRGTINKEAFGIKNSILKKIYYKLLAESVLMGSGAIHFTSNDEMMNVQKYLNLNHKSFVVPNGIDLEEYRDMPEPGNFKKRQQLPATCKYILFLGRIHKKKGIDLLISAFKKLNDKFPGIKLIISGFDNDGYEGELRNMVSSLALEKEVIFTGPLYDDDVKAAYADAECFVLPSYTENFGMAVIEAMASRCPVVISNKVGIYDIIENYRAGIVVDTDVESVYKALTLLIINPELRRNYSDNARTLVEDYFEIDKVSKEMIANYRSIIS